MIHIMAMISEGGVVRVKGGGKGGDSNVVRHIS